MFFHKTKTLQVTSRSRTSNENGRIVISGTGRAGTTFLVQLFTALGFNTGFSLDQAINSVDSISKGGLEFNDVTPSTPYIVKSPWFVDKLLPTIEAGGLTISTAIVPMRDLYSAAQSRRRVTELALKAGGDPAAHHPGGIWLTEEPAEQESKLASQYYQLMFALTKFEIPTIIIEFPRLVRDEVYLFAKLQPLLRDHGVSEVEFTAAYRRTVQPGSVHEFRQID